MAKISLIGSGKTATALGKALALEGHEFVQVWSRSEANANDLARQLNAKATTDLAAINADANIYLIAVKDDAIGEVAGQLKIGDKIVAHTSGIKSKEVLKAASPNYGIFYPYVSMTKESDVNFNNVLMMIEGSSEESVDALLTLANTISINVRIVVEDQRQSLHLAAVFAQNFTNHMYTVAEKILDDKGFSFEELRQLIVVHISSLLSFDPSVLQTGPAIRHDSTTIEDHLRLLENNKEMKDLYLTMTEAIQQWHKSK